MNTHKDTLTREIAFKAIQDFFSDTPFILFGTGTSCAVDNIFGMSELAKFYSEEFPVSELSKEQSIQWENMLNQLLQTNDLESSMSNISDLVLLKLIVNQTHKFITKASVNFQDLIFSGEIEWPAINIIKQIWKSLPISSNRALHIATTNYDLLAESSFEFHQIPYLTGFSGGLSRVLDWQSSINSKKSIIRKKFKGRLSFIPESVNHIRLYKVHGSINVFVYNEKVIENNYWTSKSISNSEPLIITPGSLKYQKLHEFRGSLLSKYDEEINNHRSFLFLGFGFNDNQLFNDSIKNKIKSGCPVLIITRDINENINDILRDNPNVWLIYKGKNLEKEVTCICNSSFKEALYIEDSKLWDFREFSYKVFGE